MAGFLDGIGFIHFWDEGNLENLDWTYFYICFRDVNQCFKIPKILQKLTCSRIEVFRLSTKVDEKVLTQLKTG